MNKSMRFKEGVLFALFFFSLTLLLLHGCRNRSGSLNPGIITLVDSITIDLEDYLPKDYNRVSQLNLCTLNDSVHLNFFNYSDTSYNSINIQSASFNKFKLEELFPESMQEVHLFNFTLQSKNDLLVITPENRIYQLSQNSIVPDTFSLNWEANNYDHYRFASNPSLYSNNKLFSLRAYKSFSLRSKSGRQGYYDSAPYSSIDINTGNLESIGNYATCFDYSDDFIADIYTQLCFNSDSTMVLNGYKYCEDIGIHDLNQTKSFEQTTLKGNGKPKFEFLSISDLDNLKLKKTTELSSAAYLNLLNDPYNKLFMRTFKAYRDLSKSVLLPEEHEIDWTLRIWDESYNYIGEYSLQNQSDIFPYFFAVGKSGMYFMHWNKNNPSDKFRIKFSQYKYELN